MQSTTTINKDTTLMNSVVEENTEEMEASFGSSNSQSLTTGKRFAKKRSLGVGMTTKMGTTTMMMLLGLIIGLSSAFSASSTSGGSFLFVSAAASTATKTPPTAKPTIGKPKKTAFGLAASRDRLQQRANNLKENARSTEAPVIDSTTTSSLENPLHMVLSEMEEVVQQKTVWFYRFFGRTLNKKKVVGLNGTGTGKKNDKYCDYGELVQKTTTITEVTFGADINVS